MSNTRYKNRKTHQQILSNDNLDSDILFKIKQYLQKKHQIRFGQIKIDHTIRITKGHCKILGKLTLAEIKKIKGLIRTPDIIVTDKSGEPWFIIEQDGQIHDSETHMKRDQKRNQNYEYANIPCIVLNSKKIREAKMRPCECIDEMLRKNGIISL